MKKIALILGILLTPLYIFSSGGIQPAHGILFLFILTQANQLLRIFLIEKHASSVLFILTIWAFFREGFGAIAHNDIRALLPAIYWLYNFLLFAAVVTFLRTRERERALELAVPGAVLVAFFGILLLGYSLTIDSEGFRSVGTFNNPNQLGYFSVCVASLMLLLWKSKNIKGRTATVYLAVAAFLSIVSLSKAAMVAVFFAGALVLWPKKLNLRSLTTSVIGIGITLTAAYSLFNAENPNDINFVRRLNQIGQDQDDSLEARGYFAFLDGNALHLIFGLDSTEVQNIVGHEVHSTIFSVFNTYGLIGLALFLIFLGLWCLRLYKNFGFNAFLYIAAPPMLYGITHNGTRFTIFWILLSASFALSRNTAQPKPHSL